MCEYDPLMFTSKHNLPRIFLLLYLDDVLIASKDLVEIKQVSKQLMLEFEMDLRTARKIVGMEINRDISVRKLIIS